MKKKIAILLSATMVASAMPMTAMASSNNGVSTTVTAKADAAISNAGNLTIRPTGSFASGDAFYIKLTNATFAEGDAFESAHQYKGVTAAKEITISDDQKIAEGSTLAFDNIKAKYGDMAAFALEAKKEEDGELKAGEGQVLARIPYKITRESETEARVELLAFNEDTIANDQYKVGGVLPYVQIPLSGLIAGGSGDMTLVVDNGGTSISNSTFTLGTIFAGNGSTSTTVSKVKTFDGSGALEKLTIKENVAGTLKGQKTITFRTSGGFNFANANDSEITLTGFRNITSSEANVKVKIKKENANTISFVLPESLTIAEDKASSFSITGLVVEPVDEEKNYGTVSLTISGNDAGITQETIEVAKREKASFNMEVLNEAPTIISGRTDLANSDLSADKFKSAKIKFSENVKEAWSSQRLDFTVPEGVQIVGVDIVKATKGGSLTSSSDLTNEGIITNKTTNEVTVGNSSYSIVNGGRTLRFNKDFNKVIDNTDATNFEFTLKLTARAGFEGDITLSAVGAGASAGDIKDVVIAKAVQPIKLETSETKVNIGYQNYSTADIVITETTPGALLGGKNVELSLTSVFNTNDIAITNADVTTEGGELTIKDVKKESNRITFKIDNASFQNPGTIRVKNVKIGTTRSIPYGTYGLAVSGEAVINNYTNKDFHAEANNSSNVNLALNNKVEKYEFANYINVVTSTGTVDNTVKVTIGEKTILIDEKAVDMDVAPYIQASSNSTMVPLRFVSVALGVDSDNVSSADASSKVAFDNNSKTATIYYGSGNSQRIIQFQAGSNKMIIDGTSINMENGVLAEIKDGRMFVPFRALGQSLGINVNWDETTRTAIYNAR